MDCNAREMFQKSSKPEPEMGMVIYDTAIGNKLMTDPNDCKKDTDC